MLQRAVELAPRDGMIIDCLGWAYYRLGRYDDAVRELEKAVELKAGDPVINDHLGDAYWKVGRKLEAKFQWNHAKDSNPEHEDLLKILKKIDNGLDDAKPDRGRERARARGGADKNGGLIALASSRGALRREPGADRRSSVPRLRQCAACPGLRFAAGMTNITHASALTARAPAKINLTPPRARTARGRLSRARKPGCFRGHRRHAST